MRITQELLHKIAHDTIKSRKRSEPDLLAAYLIGSVLTEEPLLGGTTDIDLVLVHKYQVTIERETLPVTREISLDILHKRKEDFDHHRKLRQDPWLGYPLTYNHILLTDTDHWLEFIQAGVTADFHRPDNVLARVRGMLDSAREEWFKLTGDAFPDHLSWLQQYLIVLALAANSIAGLISPPLTTRRFLLSFAESTETLGVPKMLAGLHGLLGITNAIENNLPKWLEAFHSDLSSLPDNPATPILLRPCRHAYYLDVVKAMVESGEGKAALWPLLETWVASRKSTPDPEGQLDLWTDCLQTLQLTEEHQQQKTEALDSYLDTIEQILEDWTNLYGI